MKRTSGILAGLLSLALAGTLAGCGSSSGSASGASKNQVVVGLVCDTTGPGASYATPSCTATKEAIADLNAHGGILGHQVKVVQGNDESDPTRTPAVIQKLVGKGANALIMLTSSAGVLQAKSQIERTKIPVFMSVAANPLVTSAPNNTYLYQLGTPTSVWADVYCDALKSMGATKVAVLEDNSPSQAQFAKTITDGMKCVKLDIVTGDIDATDLSAQVAKIKAGKPDAVLVATQTTNFEVLAQNTLAQQLPDVPRLTQLLLSSVPSAWAQAQPGALKGLIGFAGTTDTNPQTVKVSQFFAAKEGKDFAVSSFWTQSYDAVQILKKAFTAAGSTDGTAVNDQIQKIKDFTSSTGYQGATLSFGPDKHLGADGVCGIVLVQWGADNKITGPWPGYKPDCGSASS